MSALLPLLTHLCNIDAVAGQETALCDYLLEQAKPYASAWEVDALGSLIVHKKGKITPKEKVVVAAHMDEVGLIIHHITDNGFLKFNFVGGVDRRVAIGKPVTLGPNKIPGLIGLKAYHLVSKEEESKTPKTEDLYIDIGASTKEEALAKVPLGTYGAFSSLAGPLSSTLYKAKAIDDRLGCAIMLLLIQEDLPLDVTFAFTAMEEVGVRGGTAVAFSQAPDIALILETTTAADLPEIPGKKQVCHLGKGPVLGFMDGASIYHKPTFELLRDCAKEENIPWQIKEYVAGGNDARAFQRSQGGCKVAAISAAIRYLHAPSSVGHIQDMEDSLRLTRAFLHKLAQLDQA